MASARLWGVAANTMRRPRSCARRTNTQSEIEAVAEHLVGDAHELHLVRAGVQRIAGRVRNRSQILDAWIAVEIVAVVDAARCEIDAERLGPQMVIAGRGVDERRCTLRRAIAERAGVVGHVPAAIESIGRSGIGDRELA